MEARNSIDNLVYNVEKMLKENGDKLSGSDKTDAETALADAKAKLQSNASTSELTEAGERLTSASHKLAEAMYKANATPPEGAGPESAGTPPPTEEKKDEGVIDAEYVDVDDKK